MRYSGLRLVGSDCSVFCFYRFVFVSRFDTRGCIRRRGGFIYGIF